MGWWSAFSFAPRTGRCAPCGSTGAADDGRPSVDGSAGAARTEDEAVALIGFHDAMAAQNVEEMRALEARLVAEIDAKGAALVALRDTLRREAVKSGGGEEGPASPVVRTNGAAIVHEEVASAPEPATAGRPSSDVPAEGLRPVSEKGKQR
jgi:hypothetical protein